MKTVVTEDRQVPATEWVNREGFVKIRGVYVKGGSRVERVRVQKATVTTCQRCKRANVAMALVLWVRYEHALERLMYWFGPAPGPRKFHCDECTPLVHAAEALS